MNEGTLIVVHCWAGDRPAIEKLLPLWKHHGQYVLLLSPEDAPLRLDPPTTVSAGANSDGVFCRAAGGNGWMGTHVPHRLLAHWKIALEYQADIGLVSSPAVTKRSASWFFINEWDSFCITPELPSELYEDEDMFWGIEVEESWAVGDVTSGTRMSFPYWMSRKLLQKMVALGEEILPSITDGPDLPLYGNMSPDGFTMHLLKEGGFKHRPYLDSYDSRSGARDGTMSRIVHWHGLEDPNIPLLAAGCL